MKTCKQCRETKPLAEFHLANRNTDRRNSLCKDCRREHQRRHHLKHRWGMSPEEFDTRLIAQGGCAVCGTPTPGKTPWCVDHDHACCPGQRSCGKCIRGILCYPCNKGLGFFEDDTDRLLKAVSYLRKIPIQ